MNYLIIFTEISFSPETSSLLYKILILLLGGDIETNPGPRQKKQGMIRA